MENMNTNVRVERVKDQIFHQISTFLVEEGTFLYLCFFFPAFQR